VELRLFGVFGRYEDYGIRFISNAVCKCLFDLPITLRQNRTFSYLYVDDLLPVVDWALADAPGKVACNVAPEWTDSLGELADLVARQGGERLGKEVPVRVAKEGAGKEYSADSSRLREMMPSVSFTPVETAVERLFDWYAERLPDIDRSRLVADR
jgi:GDP-L-fucose synthase